MRTGKHRTGATVLAILLSAGLWWVGSPVRAADVTVLSDTFTRTIATGWGAADTGGTWASAGPTPSTNGSAGVLVVEPGKSTTVTAPGTQAADQTFTAKVTFTQTTPAGGGTYLSALMRSSADGSSVSARIVANPDGTAVLTLRNLTATGQNIQLGAAATLPFAVTGGTALFLKAQVAGGATTTTSAKAWKAGTAEPAGWQVSANGTGLPSVGSTGFKAYGSPTGAASPLLIDDVLVTTPGNSPPSAVFSATTQALQVSVDATGSSDSDGTVAAYAWSFGDGSTGTGRTAVHTYATAGTYPVTLTVTDDRGATATSSKSLTVSLGGYRAFWADEFSGTGLDASRWKAIDTNFGSNMGQIQCDKPANAGVASGALLLTARKQTTTCGTAGVSRPYSSAFVSSSEVNRFYPLYGRYEMRARIPQGQGVGAAFWLRHRSGAAAAEVDIMETFHSQAPGTVTQTLHFPRTLGSNVTKVTTKIESTKAELTGWHTFAVEISPAAPDNSAVRFRYYVDGVVTKDWTNSKASSWTTGYLSDAWDITLSLPVGGSWWGSPVNNLGFLSSDMIGGTSPNKCSLTYAAPPNGPASCPTDKNKDGVADIWFAAFPATFQVDYVRVSVPQ